MFENEKQSPLSAAGETKQTAAMVVIQVKRCDTDLFVVESSISESNDVLVRRLVSGFKIFRLVGYARKTNLRRSARGSAWYFDCRGHNAGAGADAIVLATSS